MATIDSTMDVVTNTVSEVPEDFVIVSSVRLQARPNGQSLVIL
jgi:hypothetical protein